MEKRQRRTQSVLVEQPSEDKVLIDKVTDSTVSLDEVKYWFLNWFYWFNTFSSARVWAKLVKLFLAVHSAAISKLTFSRLCPISIPPENVRKPKVFRVIEKGHWHEKIKSDKFKIFQRKLFFEMLMISVKVNTHVYASSWKQIGFCIAMFFQIVWILKNVIGFLCFFFSSRKYLFSNGNSNFRVVLRTLSNI